MGSKEETEKEVRLHVAVKARGYGDLGWRGYKWEDSRYILDVELIVVNGLGRTVRKRKGLRMTPRSLVLNNLHERCSRFKATVGNVWNTY